MIDFTLPFPNRELADKELTYDLCYQKIPAESRSIIVETAWNKGAEAANTVFDRFKGTYDFVSICNDSGLKLNKKDIDYVVGGQRYFSDYISGQKTINIYTKSVKLWAEENRLTLDTAINLILSHEYFHFLEINEIGLTSRILQVPMIIIGKFKIGKTGIRALSEIGAHAFARTYYELVLGGGKDGKKT